MDQKLTWTGDSESSDFHATRKAVLVYCVAMVSDPAHSLSMETLEMMGGVSSIKNPFVETVVEKPALLMATRVVKTVVFGRRGGERG